MFGVSPFGQYSLSGYTDQPVNLEGVQATIALGTVTIDAISNVDVLLNTNLLTGSIGSATQTGTAVQDLITNLTTLSLGTITPKAAADVVVTTNLSTLSSGSVTIKAAADVIPTTNLTTLSLGNTTITGFANVSPTTNLATIGLGTVTPKANADVAVTTNLAGTISVGTVSIVAKAVVIPTASPMTFSVTGPGVITWNDINTNASQTWTNIET